MALFRTIWYMGILGKERTQYWSLFFWTLFNYPKKFPMAITLTVYGYHFRKVSELHIFKDAQITATVKRPRPIAAADTTPT